MAPYWVLAAYATGIVTSLWLPPLDRLPAAAGAALLAVAWLWLRRRAAALIPLAAVLVLAGFTAAHDELVPPPRSDDVSRYVADGEAAITGIINDAERGWDGSTRLNVAVETVDRQPVTGQLRLTVGDGEVKARPGERVSWLGRLRRPELFGTPGEFDYRRHLAARGIYVTSYAGRAGDIVALAGGEQAFLQRLRLRLAERIARAVGSDSAALLQALTVGVCAGITPGQRQVLSEGGLAHLFSISGLHYTLLAMFLYTAARWFYSRSEKLLLTVPPRRVIPLALLIPLAAYLVLSGNGAPTRRAFLMAALGAWLFSRCRRTPPAALLATVALALLAVSPLSLFDASFQLSMAGVLGLIVWLPRWQKPFADQPGWQRHLLLALMTTLAATLATAPFSLWHFHQVAPAGLVANLLAVPAVSWGVLPVSLLGCVLAGFHLPGADSCFRLAAQLAGGVIDGTRLLLEVPGLGAWRCYLTWQSSVAVTLCVAAAMLPRRRCLIAGGLFASALVCILFASQPLPGLRVVALSVGQGDATLLTLDGRHYLIDGGGLTGTTIDIGERLVAPALGRLGIDRLDAVVITHAHPDHFAGLPFILEHFTVDDFWSAIPEEELPQEIRDILTVRKINLRVFSEGWYHAVSGRGATLSLYIPSQRYRNLNDRSIVVHAVYGAQGVLLPADLAAAGLEQMVKESLPAPATLLKLAHHGSRSSRPDRFLDLFQPGLAFVSVGRNNGYNLPHPFSVKACSDRGVPLWRTDRHGTLIFSSDGRKWDVSSHYPADD